MEPLTKKAAILATIAAFALIFAVLYPLLAGFSETTLAADAQTPAAAWKTALTILWPSAFALIVFFSAITFVALLGASLVFVIAPLLPVAFALYFWHGLPIALLLFSFGSLALMLYSLKIHRSAANRVRLFLPEIIRLPLSTVFLALIAVGAFAAPAMSQMIVGGVIETMIKSAPVANSPNEATPPLGDQTVRDLIAAETAKRIESCGGITSCEDALKEAVQKEALMALRPAQKKGELSDEEFLDQPLSTIYRDNLNRQIESGSMTSAVMPGKNGVIWSVLLFLILSPLSLIAAGVVTLITAVFFQGLVASGFLEIRQLPVRQDAIF